MDVKCHIFFETKCKICMSRLWESTGSDEKVQLDQYGKMEE